VGNVRNCDCNPGEPRWDRIPIPAFPCCGCCCCCCCCGGGGSGSGGGGGGDASNAFAAASSSGSPIKLPVEATMVAAAAVNCKGIMGIIFPSVDDDAGADVRRRLGSGFTRRSVVISGTLNIGDEPAYIVSCLSTLSEW
jgi:hypothetical protein